MKKLARSIFVVLLVPVVAQAAGLVPLSDAGMSQVTGQNGIAISLQTGINAVGFDPNLAQYTLPTIASGYGGPDPTLSSCTGNANPCHLALAVKNRGVSTDPTKLAWYPTDTGVAPTPSTWEPAEWLVLKDAYTLINIPTGYLNGTTLSTAPAPDATHLFNAATFQDQSGACLLAGGTCTWANLSTLNGLALSYPQQYGTTPVYCATAASGSVCAGAGMVGQSVNYTSFEMGLNIGRMAVEYSINGQCPGTGCGYNQDVHGSFAGIQIADNNSYLAGVSIKGTGYVFGF